jgi:hypothetical protein
MSRRDRRLPNLGPTLHHLFALTASLHVAPGRFTTIPNPRQIIAFAPWQDVLYGSKANILACVEQVQ